MTTYSVHKGVGNKNVVIALEDFGPTEGEGFLPVGTFEMDVDHLNGQTDPAHLRSPNGDHPFVVKAREVLAASDQYKGLNLDDLVYLDRASNAATHVEDAPTTEEMDVSEPGTDPNTSSQKGGVLSSVGTDPAETEANGEQAKAERTDQGEPAPAKSKAPDASDPAGDAKSPEQKQIDSLKDQQESKQDDQQEEQQEEQQGAAETVDQLRERVAGVTGQDELQGIYEAEVEGANRPEYVSVIEERAQQLA